MHCIHTGINSPARQRRREREAAARDSEKEPSKQEVEKTDDTLEKDPLTEEVGDSTTIADSHEEEKDSDDTGKVADDPIDDPIIVNDEVCPNNEYESAPVETSVCSIQLFPKKYTLDGLQGFRANIEDYFKKRIDVIKRVIKCEVENYGNNSKLFR